MAPAYLTLIVFFYQEKTMENVIESALIHIPVRNLVLSSLNVRKKQGGGIEELAALIASQGLIHNLVVTEQMKKGKKK